MSITYYNLSEDWGWYIDIENMRPIYQINTHLNVDKNKNKKFNNHLNKLYVIEESKYDFYIQNKRNEKDANEIIEVKINKPIGVLCEGIIKNYGSKTLITALLTYIIFIML